MSRDLFVIYNLPHELSQKELELEKNRQNWEICMEICHKFMIMIPFVVVVVEHKAL